MSRSSGRGSGNNGPEMKVVVLGDRSVGKTCLVLRFIEGFYSSVQQSTVGAFFLTKKITLESGQSFKMQLWDTAGQERYRAMAPMYYRNCNACIVCFDPTNEESFAKMKDWVDELRKNVTDEKMVLAIACNKCDLPDSQRVVSKSRSEEFAEKCNAMFFETSALADIGVTELFQSIGQEMWNKKGNDITISQQKRSVLVEAAGGNDLKKCC
jgi:Ras-related protein Rab-5C